MYYIELFENLNLSLISLEKIIEDNIYDFNDPNSESLQKLESIENNLEDIRNILDNHRERNEIGFNYFKSFNHYDLENFFDYKKTNEDDNENNTYLKIQEEYYKRQIHYIKLLTKIATFEFIKKSKRVQTYKYHESCIWTRQKFEITFLTKSFVLLVNGKKKVYSLIYEYDILNLQNNPQPTLILVDGKAFLDDLFNLNPQKLHKLLVTYDEPLIQGAYEDYYEALGLYWKLDNIAISNKLPLVDTDKLTKPMNDTNPSSKYSPEYMKVIYDTLTEPIEFLETCMDTDSHDFNDSYGMCFKAFKKIEGTLEVIRNILDYQRQICEIDFSTLNCLINHLDYNSEFFTNYQSIQRYYNFFQSKYINILTRIPTKYSSTENKSVETYYDKFSNKIQETIELTYITKKFSISFAGKEKSYSLVYEYGQTPRKNDQPTLILVDGKAFLDDILNLKQQELIKLLFNYRKPIFEGRGSDYFSSLGLFWDFNKIEFTNKKPIDDYSHDVDNEQFEENPYYNDNLDLDQQSSEFWDSI